VNAGAAATTQPPRRPRRTTLSPKTRSARGRGRWAPPGPTHAAPKPPPRRGPRRGGPPRPRPRSLSRARGGGLCSVEQGWRPRARGRGRKTRRRIHNARPRPHGAAAVAAGRGDPVSAPCGRASATPTTDGGGEKWGGEGGGWPAAADDRAEPHQDAVFGTTKPGSETKREEAGLGAAPRTRAASAPRARAVPLSGGEGGGEREKAMPTETALCTDARGDGRTPPVLQMTAAARARDPPPPSSGHRLPPCCSACTLASSSVDMRDSYARCSS